MPQQNYGSPRLSNKPGTRISRNAAAGQQGEIVQETSLRNTNNMHMPFNTILEAHKRFKPNTLGTKEVLPPIPPSRTNLDNDYGDIDDSVQDFDTIDEDSLPLKLFDGKKQSLDELSEESMSYLWFRRIKEIFLHIDYTKDNQADDPFIEFDMDLARVDLINACDRYIENERIIVTKTDANTTKSKGNSQQTGSALSIDDCINELNHFSTNPSSEELSSVLNKCIGSLQDLDKRTQDVIDKLQKQLTKNSEVDVRTIKELIQSLQTKEKLKQKGDFEKKQDWDMTKLYAEVFKMSYKRNRLRTDIEQEELTPVKKGDDQPNFGNAIWWYSCDKASIYYQINSILRLENFELLMAYRYYLSDLCKMIEFMYQERKRGQDDIIQTFYRAGHINKTQLDKMRKQQKGQLISLIGFISTTTDMDIAKGYAQKQSISKGNERVLFQISVKPQESCTAFAYIEGISFHPEEKEVLFSMGSTFAVDDVINPKDGENYYTVQLTASDIDKTLINDIRTKIEECSPSGRAALLAHYLMELGEYRAARKYLSSLLNEAQDGGILNNDPNLATIYSCLGMIYARQGLHGDALKAFKQALNTQARLEYSNNNALAEIHQSIGLAYVGLGRLNEAEETLAKALRIQLREANSDQQHLASIYGDIGYVQYKKDHIGKAFDAFEEAGKIYKKNSNKIAHDALEQSLTRAEYLTNYGHLLSVNKDIAEAQARYSEALKLYKSILRDNDPKLMQTYINIMVAYANTKKFNEVTKWFEDKTVKELIDKQELNMFELNSSVTQSSLAFLHEFVGACYVAQNLYDAAIRVWARAVVFKRKARLEQLLLETTNNISSMSINEQKSFINENYRLAREYFNKTDKDTNQLEDEQGKQLPNEFCVGLLYAESYNHVSAIQNLEKAITILNPSVDDMKLVACLLLTNLYKHQLDEKSAVDNCDQALELIKQSKTQRDRVLEVEVNLTRIECIKEAKQNTKIFDELKNTNVIDELKKLDRSLNINGSDTKYVTLKVIVYDTLARYYLAEQNYEEFDRVAEKSVLYKIRNFSQYHPSLVINSKLLAERYIQQSRYHEALYFYERALEVQSLNLTFDHSQNRKMYYAMGDIYCKLDKLSNAKEKYDVAENTNSNTDEDDVLTQDKINAEESMDILMAQISMHQHLADLYAKKKDYKQALSEMNEILELLGDELPSSAFDIDNDKALIQKNIDISTLLNSLQLLANCLLHIGDILGTAQDDDMGYEVALNIYKKLNHYDGKLGFDEIILLYKKMSQYNEDLSNIEDAIDYLQKIIDPKKPSSAVLYRMGVLNISRGRLKEATVNFRKILDDPSNSEKQAIKQIVQENLDEIQRKITSQPLNSRRLLPGPHVNPYDCIGFSEDDDDISIVSQQENEIDSEKKTENTDDLLDDRAKAFAYLELNDLEKSLESYQKYIKDHSKNLSILHTFEFQYSIIEQHMYTYEQESTSIFLPKLLRPLVEKFREGDLDKSSILSLADSFFQCGNLYDKQSLYLKSGLAYISAFDLYYNHSKNAPDTLTAHMRKILSNYVNHELQPDIILEIAQELSLPEDDITQMRLKIGAMYRDNQIEDVDDVDGDGDTSNESRMIAIQWYRDCLATSNNEFTKATCFYNILHLYEDYIYEDDEGKDDVNNMMNLLPKLSTFDRRLLLDLAYQFMKAYNNNKDTYDKNINNELQKLVNDSFNETLQVNGEFSIGCCLMRCDDLGNAETYWKSIIAQVISDKSVRVLLLVYNSDSTFDDILNAIKHSENEIDLLLKQLITTYEKMGDYYRSEAKNSENPDTDGFQKADDIYEKAIHLMNRLHMNTDDINKIDQKLHEEQSKPKNK
ncbi:unnamed protein product [Adineta steineri]|uniref:ADP ribosyltransferase domain-containing protein n=1 Tax=Adineta steineri TaxID=433720 RepID=A0A819TYX1_9BILA|nr:unnamed protein product [Adineta steineri]